MQATLLALKQQHAQAKARLLEPLLQPQFKPRSIGALLKAHAELTDETLRTVETHWRTPRPRAHRGGRLWAWRVVSVLGH